MPKRTKIPLLVAPLALAALTAAQEPKPDPKQPPSWPSPSSEAADRVKFLVRRLRSEDVEETDAAERDLVAMGAVIAPYLLTRLADRRPVAPSTLARILDEVVEPVYAPLVAERVTAKSVLVRRWAVGFLATHHDSKWRDTLAGASEDKDADVAFRAAAGLAGLGETDALPAVFEVCAADWRAQATFVALALEPARGGAAADWLVDHMPKDDERARVTGLRLMRSLAPKEYAGVVATYLDSEQHAVKKEAINALRAIVDGDEPLEELSVFQAIEQAKKWRARIG